jgi:hypothetical protein
VVCGSKVCNVSFSENVGCVGVLVVGKSDSVMPWGGGLGLDEGRAIFVAKLDELLGVVVVCG